MIKGEENKNRGITVRQMVKGTKKKKKKGFIVLEPENVKKGRGNQPSLMEPHALHTLGG